jgi:hypothetical protein
MLHALKAICFSLLFISPSHYEKNKEEEKHTEAAIAI